MQSHFRYLQKIQRIQLRLSEQLRLGRGQGLGSRGNGDDIALTIGELADSPDAVVRRSPTFFFSIRRFPFKSRFATGLGGDAAAFAPAGFESSSRFSSYGPGVGDYQLTTASPVDATTATYTANGRKNWVVNSLSSLVWRALDFWASGDQRRFLPTPAVIGAEVSAIRTGTPVDAFVGIQVATYPSKSGWISTYPSGYSQQSGAVPIVDFSFAWNPGYSNLLVGAVVSVNTGLRRFTDQFTSGGSAPAEYAPAGCVEEDAGNNPQAILTGTGPGRRASNTVQYNLSYSFPAVSGQIFSGVATTSPVTHTVSASYSLEVVSEVDPSQYTVTVDCVGTGTISFVPRLRFTSNPGTRTWRTTLNFEQSLQRQSSQDFPLLPGITTPIAFANTESVTVTRSPITNASTTVTRERITSSSTTSNTIEGLFYDELATSCLYLAVATTQTSVVTRTDVAPRTSQNLSSYGFGEVPGQPILPTENSDAGLTGASTTSETTTRTNLIESVRVFRSESGTTTLGDALPTISSQLSGDYRSFEAGDLITVAGVTVAITVARGRLENRVGTSGAFDTTWAQTFPAESQIVGRRFLLVQRPSNPIEGYLVLDCICEGLGALTGNNFTSLQNSLQNFYSGYTLRVVDKVEGFRSPPVLPSLIQVFRYDNVADLSFSNFSTTRRATDSGVLWDIYHTTEPPVVVAGDTQDQKHFYSRTRLLADGSLEYLLEEVEGDYIGHPGRPFSVRVNPL